ncbi:MAG TPA: sigma-70 family RNA polymerase sigma factor [Spirochaetota bacterium]
MLSKAKTVTFYRSFSKELLFYLRKLTGNNETAEDLLHDTFANLIEYSKTRDIDETSVRAFLYRTAHNLAINFLQKNKRSSATDIDSMTDVIKSDDSEKTIGNLEADELNARIYHFLDTIEPRDRSMFILHKELGKNYNQISAELGISERTVRRRMKSLLLEIYELLETGGYL